MKEIKNYIISAFTVLILVFFSTISGATMLDDDGVDTRQQGKATKIVLANTLKSEYILNYKDNAGKEKKYRMQPGQILESKITYIKIDGKWLRVEKGRKYKIKN